MLQEVANLRFALISGEDGCTPDDIVIGKLENHLLEHTQILCQEDMARGSSGEQMYDLIVINSLTWPIDSWHTSSVSFCIPIRQRPCCAAQDGYRCLYSCAAGD